MLKVLLVDDEPFILQGMSVIIDWYAQGFEIVGKVSNAFEALELLRKEKIDLVIADIKMPEMTGLELLQKVRSEKISDAYFVILSGYNDFDYARTALQNDCLDYMLKPIAQNELLKVLGKVREKCEINSKRQKDNVMMEREAFAGNMIPICHGRFRPENIDYVKKYLEGGDDNSFRYISVELDGERKEIKCLTGKEKKMLQKELYQKCILLFPGREYLCILDATVREEIYNVGIIYTEAILRGTKEITEQEYLEELKKNLKSSVDFPIRILVGSKVDRIEAISDSGRSVMMAHSLRGFDTGEQSGRNLSEHLMDKQLADALIRAVKLNDKEGIRSGYEALSEGIRKREMDEHMVNMMINYLMFEFLHLALEQDENVDRQEVSQFIHAGVAELANKTDKDNMLRKLSEFGDYLMQLRSHQSSEILGQIAEDIRMNYRENLTLKDLGKKYFINSAYLGQTFKKQYGESFKDYLNRVRIEEAEKLLLYSDKKIYEIAEEVGYKDLDYFINKFIALKGCTPAKFRRQVK